MLLWEKDERFFMLCLDLSISRRATYTTMKQIGATYVNLYWLFCRKEVELIFFFTCHHVFLKDDGFINVFNVPFFFLS